MVMPGSQEKIAIVFHDAQDIRKFPRIEAITVGNRYGGFKPDFGVPAATLNVNMRRLGRLPFVGEEVVAQAALAYCNRLRHRAKYVPLVLRKSLKSRAADFARRPENGSLRSKLRP